MIPIRYNVRSLAVRKATTVATASGIALVVFVLASSMMLSAGIRKTLGTSGRPENAIVLRMGSDAELGSIVEDSAVPLILAAPGVRVDEKGQPIGAAEIVVVGAMEKIGASGVTNVQIRGVSDNVLSFRPDAHLVAGRAPRPGADEAMIGARIRGRIKGLDLDQSFELKKNRPVTVVGVFAADGSSYESEVWVDRELLSDAYNRRGMRLGLQAMRETTFYEKQSEGASTFVKILGGIVSVFFAAGAMIGAMITMYAAVANRQREIGTLRALGFSRSSVLTSFVLEAVILSAVGGAVGAAASMAMGFVQFSMVNFASWSEIVFSFDPTPPIIGWSLGFACGMGLFGGLLPAVRAAATSPLKAIRG